MMDGINFAKKQAGRIARRKTFIFLICIAVIAYLLVTQMPRDLFSPYAVITDSAELTALHDQKRGYVTATAEEFFDTGYYASGKGQMTAQYYTFFAGNQYIICRMDKSFTGDDFENYVIYGLIREPNSTERRIIDSVAGEIADAWGISSDEASEYVAPLLIGVSASGDGATGLTSNQLWQQGVHVVIAVAGLIFLLQIVRGWMGVADYTRLKAYKKMTLGGTRDPEWVNETLSRELEIEPELKASDKLFTRSFVVFPSPFGWTVQSRADLAWIYKSVTRHYTNGIPSGKTYAVTLRFITGYTDTLPSNKKSVDALLLRVCALCPDAAVGYNPDMEARWNADKETFRRQMRDNP